MARDMSLTAKQLSMLEPMLFGMIRAMARKFNNRFIGRGDRYEEYYSAGMEGIIQAVQNFNTSKGQLRSLVYQTANRRMLDVARAHAACPIFAPTEVLDTCTCDATQEDEVSATEEVQRLMQLAPKDEQAIVTLRMAGYTYQDIGSLLNMSRQQVFTKHMRFFERARKEESAWRTN